MAQARPHQGATGQRVALLPQPSWDGREPWPRLEVSPTMRALLTTGQVGAQTLGPLPQGAAAGPAMPQATPLPSAFTPPQGPAATRQNAASNQPSVVAPSAAPVRTATAHHGATPWGPQASGAIPPGMAHVPAGVYAPSRGVRAAGRQVTLGSAPGSRAEKLARRAVRLGAWSFIFAVFTAVPAIVCANRAIAAAKVGVAPPKTIARAKAGRTLAIVALLAWVVVVVISLSN